MQLTMSKKTDIATLYLDHLTNDHTLLGMQVQHSTLKDYMNIWSNGLKPYVGRNIRYHPPATALEAPMS